LKPAKVEQDHTTRQLLKREVLHSTLSVKMPRTAAQRIVTSSSALLG